MLSRALSSLLAAALAVGSSAASAAEPLVTVDWVKAHVGKPGIVFVDLRPQADYLRGHVPGAVHTDFEKDGWRADRADGVPDQFPADTGPLGQMIGRLGIGDETLAVLLPPGSSALDMGMGTRIYWTLKVLGHDQVSLVDGGMAAWIAAGGPMEPGQAAPAAQRFTVRLRKGMLAGKGEVKAAIASRIPLVDARPEDQYLGAVQNPKTRRSGTIPGARSVPASRYTENGGGKFLGKDRVAALYRADGIPTKGKTIHFCNTGHLASVGWFVDSELLGNRSALLYSGSMAEWTADPDLPVEQKTGR